MLAISLWQPWASLVACGAKPFETRHWAPPAKLIGQPIAIHAAKKVDKEAANLAEDLLYGQLFAAGGVDLSDRLFNSYSRAPDRIMGRFGDTAMPIGCVVAIAKLDAAFLLGDEATDTAAPAMRVAKRMTSRPMPECFTVRVDAFGNYAPGRWAWLLRDVKAINPPAPAKGAQGFFELPQGWLTGGGA